MATDTTTSLTTTGLLGLSTLGGEHHPLAAEGSTTIGAGPKCDLRLEGPGLRPLHCVVVQDAHGATVRRWAAGAKLNGRSFTEAPLHAGDCLSIGPVELRVIDQSPEPEADSPELPVEVHAPEDPWNDAAQPETGGTELGVEPQEQEETATEETEEQAPAAEANAQAPEVDDSPAEPEVEGQIQCHSEGWEFDHESAAVPPVADSESVQGIPSPLPNISPIPAHLLKPWQDSQPEETQAEDEGPFSGELAFDEEFTEPAQESTPADPFEFETDIAWSEATSETTVEPGMDATPETVAIEPGQESDQANAPGESQSVDDSAQVDSQQTTNPWRTRARKMVGALRQERVTAADMRQELTSVSQRQEALQGQVAELESALQARDEMAARLEANQAEALASLEQLREELSNAQTNNRELTAQLQQASLAAEEASNAQAAWELQRQELEQQRDAALRELEALKQQSLTSEVNSEPVGESTNQAPQAPVAEAPASAGDQSSWESSAWAPDTAPEASPEETSLPEPSAEQLSLTTSVAADDAWESPWAGEEAIVSQPESGDQAPAADSPWDVESDANATGTSRLWGDAAEVTEEDTKEFDAQAAFSEPATQVDAPVAGADWPSTDTPGDESGGSDWGFPRTDEPVVQQVEETAASDWLSGEAESAAPLATATAFDAPDSEPTQSTEPTPETSPDQAELLAEIIAPQPETLEQEPAPEAEANDAQPQSFYEQYAHLLPSDDSNEPADVAVAEPTPIAAAVAEPVEEEEDIEAYMEQLMQRMRGGSAEAAPATPTPAVAPAAPSVPAQQEVQQPAPVEPPAAPEEPLLSLDDLKKTAAPEQGTDMGSLRMLANQSARQAIGVAASKQNKEQSLANLVIANIALASGGYLVASAPAIFSAQLFGGSIALLLGGVWVFRSVSHLIQAIRTGTFDDTPAPEVVTKDSLPIVKK